MSAAGVMTALVRSGQLSASSPASLRASSGARVCARVEEEIMSGVRRVFIGQGRHSVITQVPLAIHI